MPIANQVFRSVPYAAKAPTAPEDHDTGRKITFEKVALRIEDAAVAFEPLHV